MFMLHCPQGEGSLVVLMDYGEGVWGWGGGGGCRAASKFSVNGESEVAA